MLDELRAASGALGAALDRYLNVCISVKQLCSKGVSEISCEAVNLIVNELLLINSYKTKFQQADVAISLARNTIPTVVIANTLPDEILSRIFYFVICGEPCQFHHTYEYPTYPLLLARVCSRWHHVAMNSPRLWSHIDISSHGFRGSGERHERHLAHANYYLARAGRTQLDIHIAENFPYGLYIGDSNLASFLVPLANRIRSLEIHVELEDGYRPDAPVIGGEFYDNIISSCLRNCTPGILKCLTLIPKGGDNTSFIETHDVPEHSVAGNGTPVPPITLEMSEKELEGLLSPITHLKLNGSYPYWTSKAYQGLIELRLYHSDSWSTHISDSQFSIMLASSPQLEILEFGLRVRPSASQPSPVPLYNLRTLIVDTVNPNTFLPLIDPGPGPIALSLLNPRRPPWDSETMQALLIEHPEIGLFISQWNITEFCARDFLSLEEICGLVDLMPSVKTLTLSTKFLDHEENLNETLEALHSQISLDALSLVSSSTVSIEYSDLRFLFHRYHVKKLVLASDYLIIDTRDTILITRNELRDALMDLNVAVEFYSSSDLHPMVNLGHDFTTYKPSDL